MQSLRAKGGAVPETVKCIVYERLSDKECLQLGLAHNTVDTYAKKMTFMEEVRLIRQVTKMFGKEARKQLRDIFSMKVLEREIKVD